MMKTTTAVCAHHKINAPGLQAVDACRYHVVFPERFTWGRFALL